jgi:hypothetical protein
MARKEKQEEKRARKREAEAEELRQPDPSAAPDETANPPKE